MRIEDVIYFSPSFKFKDIDWNNKDQLIEAFRDRVCGFYLTPAEYLNSKKNGFATGLLCVVTIDFLARIAIRMGPGPRIKEWIEGNIKEFKGKNHMCKKFLEDFRNGLVHEGRIKNVGQFTYDIQRIYCDGDVMLINPDKFLNSIKKSFQNYVSDIKVDEEKFKKFKELLMDDFKKEIELTGK
jgi:hypothetical protein